MNGSKNIRYVLWLTISMVLLSVLMYGCIDEERCDCRFQSVFYLKVIETSTGEDITSNGDVAYADMYLFDENGRFYQKIEVSGEEITGRKPVRVNCPKNQDKIQIFVWGNLGAREVVPELSPDYGIENSTVQMVTLEDGYALSPDDLFYGSISLTKKEMGCDEALEIPVYRKNARMNVTVKGVSGGGRDEDYFFRIEQLYNGYNFRGDPIPRSVKIKEGGKFVEQEEYISATPFNMVHFTEKELEGEQGIKLSFMGAAGNEIQSAETDVNGNPIRLKSGMMTNVLIDLTKPAGMNVSVIVTDWDEIHQWVDWNGYAGNHRNTEMKLSNGKP